MATPATIDASISSGRIVPASPSTAPGKVGTGRRTGPSRRTSLSVARPCIINWYAEDASRWAVVSALNHEQAEVSIRLLDWLVTTYSKDHAVVYRVRDGRAFSMHRDYRSALRASFSKTSFDPFRRRVSEEIWFNGTEIMPPQSPGAERTTLGQLAFFRWAISNRVYEYAVQNRAALETAMVMDNQARKGRTASRGDGSGSGTPDTPPKRLRVDAHQEFVSIAAMITTPTTTTSGQQ